MSNHSESQKRDKVAVLRGQHFLVLLREVSRNFVDLALRIRSHTTHKITMVRVSQRLS
jgi:hypothetical protein